MEEGEEGTEIPPEVMEQTAAPSESVDGTDKDTGRQEDSDEGTNGDSEDQLGNSWGHVRLPRDVYLPWMTHKSSHIHYK
jgi:hypothetical protein